jgi:hypothetical protein
MNNIKKACAASLVAGSFLLASPAFALTYTLPGRSINVNPDTGAVNLNNNGQNINVQKGTSNNSATITNPGGNASIHINANTATGQNSVELKYNGETIKVNEQDDLETLAQKSQALDDVSAQAIISFKNNSSALIKTDNDLKVYGDLVVQKRPAVEAINVSNSDVEVSYTQPGRLFGIFKKNMPAKVIVSADGKVQVKLPWYSFLVVKNTGDLTAEIKTNLGSDAASISSTNSSTQVQATARVINVVSSSVQNHSSASVQTGGRTINADSSGTVRLQDNARVINIKR